jgi:hypothetical protein
MTANIIGENAFNKNPHWAGPRPYESVTDAEAAGFEWLRRLAPSATLHSWVLNNHWGTNFPPSQAGVLTFRYGLLPHNTGYDSAAANRFGMEQARPLIAASVKAPVTSASPVLLDNPRVVIASLRAEADGLAVTLRSLSDKPETVVLIRPGQAGQTTIEMLPFGIVRRILK